MEVFEKLGVLSWDRGLQVRVSLMPLRNVFSNPGGTRTTG